MSVATDPDSSRRLARAMNLAGPDFTFEQRIDAGRAALSAATWKDLPQWLRKLVAEVELEHGPS